MSDLKQDLESLRLPIRACRLDAAAALAVGGWCRRGHRRDCRLAFASAEVEVETVQAAVETGVNLTAGSPVLTASGYVVARRRAVVSAKIQGRLAELHVEE